MKAYQIIYFLIGMAISLGNHFFFIRGVMGHGNPEGIIDDIMVWVFAIMLGLVMSWSATWYYRKQEKEKA